jgi:dTMP kinase
LLLFALRFSLYFLPSAVPSTPPSWLSALRGKFLAFEGPDGSGKTTQYRHLMALLHEHKVPVCEVREPGGTPIGESVRQILLHTKDDMTLRCEMLLYMASRAQLVQERIRPAMLKGDVVLADRFVASTLAYQGAAGGLPIEEIHAVAQVAVQGCWPHLNIVFDVDEDTAARRISPIVASSANPSLFLTPGPPSASESSPSLSPLRGEVASLRAGEGSSTREHHAPDRIESRGREFHRKVRFGYLEQVKLDPKHYAIIDAAGTVDQVWDRLTRELAKRFGA